MRKLFIPLLFILLAFTASAQQYIYPGSSTGRTPVYGGGYGAGYIPGSLTEVYLDFSYGAFLPSGSYSQAGDPNRDYRHGLAGGVDLGIYVNGAVGFNFTVAAASYDSEPIGSEYMDFWHFMLGLGLSAKVDIYPFFELYVNGGIAAVGAKFDIPFPNIEYNPSSMASAFGFYIDVGGRAFVSQVVYVHLKARYLGAAELDATITNSGAPESVSVDLTGFYIMTGFGVIF